jgi:transposase InsO family protein
MFLLLVAVAEVVGRALTTHVDRWLHVNPLAPSDASYYPFLLVGVKIAAALACAALLARATRAWAAADAGGRLLHAVGHGHEHRKPRLRPGLSPRVWLGSFLATSLIYLVHSDADGIVAGRWQMFAPWLHSYALPIFAVLAVLIAALWRVAGWLYDVEEYAERAIARVRRILTAALRPRNVHARPADDIGPRRRFGLAFESRPPPLAA